MKKIYAILVIILCLIFVSCYSDDYDSNRFISLSIEDAVIFDNDENYVVGDTIFVDLNFSRYLPEEGFSNLLDIYESSGADIYYYNYGLNKFSELSNGFQRVNIDSEFLFAEKGSIDVFERGGVVLNADETLYESRIGLVLAEAGRFQFDFEFLNIYSDNYSRDKVQIELRHGFTGTPPSFEFTVTEE
jgi:hypothetical protein